MFRIDISNILRSVELFSSKPKLASYQINNSLDEDRIKNGMCPEYALGMSFRENSKYWQEGHDWIRGLTPLQTEMLNAYNIENNINVVTDIFINKYDKIPMSISELRLRKILEEKMDDFIENPETFIEVPDSHAIDITPEIIEDNEWYLNFIPQSIYVYNIQGL
jgi:hypothetical protein